MKEQKETCYYVMITEWHNGLTPSVMLLNIPEDNSFELLMDCFHDKFEFYPSYVKRVMVYEMDNRSTYQPILNTDNLI